ncbi:MAG: hypothetical protein AB8B50_15335 [Pirellulaceae bacterium]
MRKDQSMKFRGSGFLPLLTSAVLISFSLGVVPLAVQAQDEPVPTPDATRATDKSDSDTDSAREAEAPRTSLLLAVGASGNGEYEEEFATAAQAWRDLAKRKGWKLVEIKPTKDQDAKQRFSDAIESTNAASETWIVMIGHGTFARNVAKFNLVGPDVSATEMKKWLQPSSGSLVLVHAFSCSGPFLQELSGKNRILLSATKSGAEYNYARFGKFLGQSIAELGNDLDHDNAVSLLEAFLAAHNLTQRFYTEQARLATEHALLSDNGDQYGTPGDFFTGVRPSKDAEGGSPIDGRRASRVILLTSPDSPVFSDELSKQRKTIEDSIDRLRKEKEFLSEADYLTELEIRMLKLADLYETAESNSNLLDSSIEQSEAVAEPGPEEDSVDTSTDSDATLPDEPESPKPLVSDTSSK